MGRVVVVQLAALAVAAEEEAQEGQQEAVRRFALLRAVGFTVAAAGQDSSAAVTLKELALEEQSASSGPVALGLSLQLEQRTSKL